MAAGVGKRLMIVSMNVEQETREPEIAASDALQAEFGASGDRAGKR